MIASGFFILIFTFNQEDDFNANEKMEGKKPKANKVILDTKN